MAIYTGANWGDPPEGTILQYRQNSSNSNWTNSSTQNWFEVLNYNITPHFSSSKILVMVSVCGGFGNAENSCMKIVRNSSDIFIGSGGGRQCSIGQSGLSDLSTRHRLSNSNFQCVDSPNTTSNTTYRIYLATRADEGNKSWRFNSPWESNTAGYNYHGHSVITLLEIAQ